MQAYIGVVDSPYFAVSGKTAAYRIGNLPLGIYNVAIWREKWEPRSNRVTLAPHSNTQADVTFNGTN
jgi:hypothetical protein